MRKGMEEGRKIWLSFLEEQKLRIAFSLNESEMDILKTLKFQKVTGDKEFSIEYNGEIMNFSRYNFSGMMAPIKKYRWVIHDKDKSPFLTDVWSTVKQEEAHFMSEVFTMFFENRPEFFQTADKISTKQKNYVKMKVYTWHINNPSLVS